MEQSSPQNFWAKIEDLDELGGSPNSTDLNKQLNLCGCRRQGDTKDSNAKGKPICLDFEGGQDHTKDDTRLHHKQDPSQNCHPTKNPT